MAEEYVIPLGADASGFLDGVKEATKTLDALENKAKEAGTVLTDTMGKGAAATATLDVALVKNKGFFASLATSATLFAEKIAGIKTATAKGLDTKPISTFSRFILAAKTGVKEFAAGVKEGFAEARKEAQKTTEVVEEGQKKETKAREAGTTALKEAGAATLGGTEAMELFNAVIEANPIGILVAGLVLVGGALKEYFLEVSDATKITNDLTDVQIKAAQGSVDEKVELQSLLLVAKDETKSKEERIAAIDLINEKMPSYLEKLTLETINTDAGTAAVLEYVKTIEKKALAQAYAAKLQELYNKLIEIESVDLADNVSWYEKLYIVIKNGGNATLAQTDILLKGIENRKKNIETIKGEIGAIGDKYAADVKSGKAIIDVDNKVQENKKKIDGDNAKQKKQEEKDAEKLRKQQERDAKAANKKPKAEKKEANGGKTDIEYQVAENKKLERLIYDLRNTEIEAIKDVDKAKKEKINLDFERKKTEIENEVKLIGEREKKIRSQKVISKTDGETLKIIEQEKEAEAKLLIAATLKRDRLLFEAEKERKKKELELNNAAILELSQLDEKNLPLKLKVIDNEFDARAVKIKEDYKKEGLLRDILLAALEKDRGKQKKDTTIATEQTALNKQEAFMLAQLDLLNDFGKQSVEQEKLKQLSVLYVKEAFAKSNLELLKKNGKEETDQEVINAEILIKTIEKKIKEIKPKLSLAEVMGLSEKNISGIADAFGENAKKIKGIADDMFASFNKAGATTKDKILAISGAVSGIAQVGIDAIQKQIDKRQEAINQFNEQINNLETQLQKEKELQKEGLANNVGTLEQEIAEKKRLRDEELKQKEELQEKQVKLQKAQFISDTIAQTVGLISASVDIIKGFSKIPIIGLGLGIGAVGAMFAAFAAIKAKAYSNVGKQSLGEGGWVTGESHERGGQKYVSNDGRGGVVELEGDEYVVRKKNAKKHRALVEALNADSFRGLQFDDSSFKQMLNDMGIQIEEETKQTVSASKAINSANAVLIAAIGNREVERYLKSMDENIKVLSDAEANKETVTETDTEKTIKGKHFTRVIKKQ